MKRLICGLVVSLTCSAAVAGQFTLYLVCNNQLHNHGRYARVGGPYNTIKDCDEDRVVHIDHHSGDSTEFSVSCSQVDAPPPTAAAEAPRGWGALDEIAKREWTTESEPRPRVSTYRWVEPERVLEARHGFVSRRQFGDDKFADTVQRFIRDGKTGTINVTYTYEDGRPPLKTVMTVGADGSVVETFTDANGVKKRNVYESPSVSVNLIKRQELRGGQWTTLGTTRKGGLTQMEIAENKRRAEEQRQLAIAQENARRAAEQARIQQQRAYEEAQAQQQQEDDVPQQGMGMNMLGILNGLASSIQQQNQQQQADFSRRMNSYSSGGGSSSGGAIIISNAPEPTYTPPPPPPPVVRAPVQAPEPEKPKLDCWGRPVTASSSSSSSGSGHGSKVCPQ